MHHSVKDVWSFLGFANFYWCFIHNFADIAKPLNALMQKGKKWTWGETEESAFSTLKRATTSAVGRNSVYRLHHRFLGHIRDFWPTLGHPHYFTIILSIFPNFLLLYSPFFCLYAPFRKLPKYSHGPHTRMSFHI